MQTGYTVDVTEVISETLHEFPLVVMNVASDMQSCAGDISTCNVG